MQIVIELTDEQWKSVKDGTWCGSKEILNGIPLPAGHGRIGDFDALIKQMDARIKTWRDNDAMWYAAVVETAINEVAQVLIEADGGGAE